ncbi:MAG: hypothetical protein FJ299_15575, partial [Planctomycetes bacterium]|nr:hypothetical protein [Planctomycetota bacterium]
MSDAAPTSAPSAQAARPRRWLTWLKLGLAGGLLAFVAARLPWRDRVELKWSDGSQVVEGVLEGDWRAEQVAFLPREAVAPAAAWPPEIGAALARGERVQL